MEDLIESFSMLGRARKTEAVAAFDVDGVAFALVGGAGIHFVGVGESKTSLLEFLTKNSVWCVYVADDKDYAILAANTHKKIVHIKTLGCSYLGSSGGPYVWREAKFLKCKERVRAILVWLERGG